ncbi:MAG: type IV toxin-antitoxin system AbiEi family antitoxin domain-containing protein [Bryobacteraceae bacterium]
MGLQNYGKLNWLQLHLPEGLLVDAAWLQRQGYSSGLRSKYVAHGWLDQVVRGAYRRPPAKLRPPDEDEALRWEHVVISLQTLLECPLAVGGRTALELQGFAHYLTAAGPREIHLYGGETPPGWVSKLKLEAKLVFHNAEKLFKNGAVPRQLDAQNATQADRNTNSDLARSGFVRQPWGTREWPLIMSSPERAILELLDEVPRHETFHQADVLMEGLSNLSPRKLHTMLVQCRSVKVKRLFLWFAERHNHAWLKRLDREGIDLGRGKRMLARGGKLNTKFSITVPEDLDARG